MPSTPLRRQLRGLGHALAPVVQIGKQGAAESVLAQTARALGDHELIKIKLGSECPQTRFEVAERLGSEPGVKVVQILGRTLLLYKRHPKQPKYEKAEKSAEAEAPKAKPRAKREAKPRRSRRA